MKSCTRDEFDAIPASQGRPRGLVGITVCAFVDSGDEVAEVTREVVRWQEEGGGPQPSASWGQAAIRQGVRFRKRGQRYFLVRSEGDTP